MNNKLVALFIALGGFCLTSCEGFFGTKTDASFIDSPEYQARNVAYVPILPIIDGVGTQTVEDNGSFGKITSMTAGFDRQMYVVDSLRGEIVSFDAAGVMTGYLKLPGVRAIAQTRTLDLLAVGKKDTIIQNNKYSLAVVYRINLKNQQYGLTGATPQIKVMHPFYFKSNISNADADVVFNGITTLADGKYYVTRSGPRNNTNQFSGPDDNVLLFGNDDRFITPVSVTTQLGVVSNYFKKPMGITSLIQPPQTFQVRETEDFIFTSMDENFAISVQHIEVRVDDNGQSYEVKILPPGDTSQADGYLYTPSRFSRPVDVAFAGDGTNFIFVADQAKDSVYQFTNTGWEGVRPPAGSVNAKKFIKTSFGGGEGATRFYGPVAVAYMNRTLFVADQISPGRCRILRFQLTIDIN
jgi:hypothetical protein